MKEKFISYMFVNSSHWCGLINYIKICYGDTLDYHINFDFFGVCIMEHWIGDQFKKHSIYKFILCALLVKTSEVIHDLRTRLCQSQNYFKYMSRFRTKCRRDRLPKHTVAKLKSKTIHCSVWFIVTWNLLSTQLVIVLLLCHCIITR